MKTHMIWLPLAAAACIGLLACTHRPYHPDKPDRAWASDHADCEVAVRTEIRDEPAAYDQFDEMKMIKACMKEKGWRWERASWFTFKPVEAEKAPDNK
ncbi:hypothetical protein JCM12296A_30270 [Desulfosarcina cetonica]|uniref:hypothetical protein n=1 Tax=Desulfosarcina cetonica TaxID=90730 RepID=UPI0012ECF283|nr:hypothetical protein [Desulfosarcina cetonica]